MSDYLLISEICRCEDYPCCGHERGAMFPVEREVAEELAAEGKAVIVGKYRFHFDDDIYFDDEDDE